jgi:hypothetical protein
MAPKPTRGAVWSPFTSTALKPSRGAGWSISSLYAVPEAYQDPLPPPEPSPMRYIPICDPVVNPVVDIAFAPTPKACQGDIAPPKPQPPPELPPPTRYISSCCGTYERKALFGGLTYARKWLPHSFFLYVRESLFEGLIYVHRDPILPFSHTLLHPLFTYFYTFFFYGELLEDIYTKSLHQITKLYV